jgi:predicted lipoprotein with Yx(FWY)xxD motif
MRLLRTITGLAAVLAFVAACSSPSGSGTTAGGGPAGSVATSTGQLGTILVSGGDSRTLYFADGESAMSVKCTGECLSFWTPLTVSGAASPSASAGLSGSVGSFHRADGATQVTFQGHPLYTFKLDNAPGDTAGNDFMDAFGGVSFTWHAVTAAGTAASSGGQPASSGSGYGY